MEQSEMTPPTIMVEKDCIFTHAGRTFESGGAYILEDRIRAYVGADGILPDWHGNALGTWRTVSTWAIPRSFLSSTQSQIEATVNGRVYTGRRGGVGLCYYGKIKRGQ